MPMKPIPWSDGEWDLLDRAYAHDGIEITYTPDAVPTLEALLGPVLENQPGDSVRLRAAIRDRDQAAVLAVVGAVLERHGRRMRVIGEEWSV